MGKGNKEKDSEELRSIRGLGVVEELGTRRIRGLKPEMKETSVNEGLIKKVAEQVAKEIGKNIKLDSNIISSVIQEEKAKRVKIKTDYDFPIEDETKSLKSNIDKIGAKLEKQKSDIDKSVGLFKNIKKGG